MASVWGPNKKRCTGARPVAIAIRTNWLQIAETVSFAATALLAVASFMDINNHPIPKFNLVSTWLWAVGMHLVFEVICVGFLFVGHSTATTNSFHIAPLTRLSMSVTQIALTLALLLSFNARFEDQVPVFNDRFDTVGPLGGAYDTMQMNWTVIVYTNLMSIGIQIYSFLTSFLTHRINGTGKGI